MSAPAPDVSPLAPADAEQLDWSVNGLQRSHPVLSARRRLSRRQAVGFAVLVVVLVGGFAFVPVVIGTSLMALLIALYAGALWMRLDLSLRASADGRFQFSGDELAALDPATLPTFTIFVPAYKEPDVLPTLMSNLAALDYPKELLQILLLLEADDDETIAAAHAHAMEDHVEIVLIPPSQPRTKPKALNYALNRATGDIITIYDAEDRPEPQQLRKVAATFAACGPEVACVQAELAFFNADENIITRWFATEYAMWFRQFLPGLAAVDAAIPLGGTSNHMRRELLTGLFAWDPYNVTEDADLGVRLRRRGYRVAVLDSITEEEANVDFVNWIKQRSRWYKGYAQTWLVHMRHPVQLVRELGFVNFIRFNCFVGGTPLLALLNPVSWFLLLLWFMLQPQFLIDVMPAPIYYSGLLVWIVGNSLLYYLNLAMAFDLGLKRVFRAALLLPVYWAMMSLAAVKAILQLVVNPDYWEKTEHGLSRQAEPAVVDPVPA